MFVYVHFNDGLTCKFIRRWYGKSSKFKIYDMKVLQYHQRVKKRSCITPPRWRRGRALASHAGERGSIPGRDKPKSLKQVVTAPLPNARQKV